MIDCSDFSLEPMCFEHLDQVCEIEGLCFSDAWSRALFEEELKNPVSYSIVILNGENEVVAYGVLWKVFDEGHIMNVAVHPEYRRLGLGDNIIYDMIKYSINNNIAYMTLEVRKSNEAARNLYYKFGFKDSGVRKGYYQDTKEDAIIMWRVNKQ